jgi:CubicO group peptidase (beta-lactamase class C family)
MRLIPFTIADALDALGRHVRPFPISEVTAIDRATEVADPAEAGLTAAAREEIWGAVEALYESGLQPAIALCLRRRGRVVIDRAIGHVRGNAPGDPPGTPLVKATPRTLFNIFSASKAVTAMLVHLLDERRLVHLDDAVAEYIPEFGCHGKEWITIRHVLTHRAGIPTIPGRYADMDLLADPDRIVRLLCEARPRWRPGRRLSYHALTGGYVFGEVVRRVTGVDIRTFLRREVLDPLRFEHLSYGVAPAEVPAVAVHAFTGPPVLPPLSWVVRSALGVDFPDAVRLSNDPRFLTAVIPAGNVIATANEVSRFYELLLRGGELDGVRIFEPRTIRRAVAEQTYLELDLTLLFPVRYGMGFILGADHLSLYGPRTPHAFGHLGFTNVICWADPERDISACLMTSGKPFASPRLVRLYDIVRRIARLCPRDFGRG